jgi:hypothetical protein
VVNEGGRGVRFFLRSWGAVMTAVPRPAPPTRPARAPATG